MSWCSGAPTPQRIRRFACLQDCLLTLTCHLAIDELTFRIKLLDCPYENNKIFVYGTQVEDFHTLKKEYIFTLNVCATQELHRRIEAQDARIKELEAKMSDILKYLSL